MPTCANSFLNGVLRGEWNFSGYITSDTGAVEDIYSQHKYEVAAWEQAKCMHVFPVFVWFALRCQIFALCARYRPTEEASTCAALKDGGCDIDSGKVCFLLFANYFLVGVCLMGSCLSGKLGECCVGVQRPLNDSNC